MKYFILIHADEQGGFWGECPELPGCFSQGETPDELMSNMEEAIGLYLEGEGQPAESNKINEIKGRRRSEFGLAAFHSQAPVHP
ncbi:MAG: type II toxin-antitoxin system HicB family antitoxin [Synergistaceae bacterium]|jgi:predicted RNase H-like HicB family nuclease|nr:type II toxin-antitoxin system HicB family antitoxin [Synergistaceae bacterium]